MDPDRPRPAWSGRSGPRWLAGFGAAIAVSAAVAGPPGDKGSDPPGVVRMSAEQQKTVKLRTARAERRPITEPLRLPGDVVFDQGHVAVIRPLAPATVVRLLVQPGDPVRADQALAEVEIPSLIDAQDSLAAAQAAIKEAEAGVAVARDALRRGEILARDGSLSRAEAERRRLALAQAVAQADVGRARLTALRARVSRLHPANSSANSPGDSPGAATLVAPIAGVVVAVGVTPGELVDTARAAFTVADLSVVLVQAQVTEADAARVSVGDPARVALLTGGRSWEGRIVALGAEIDTGARTLPARIRLDNEDGALRAGMAVDVTVTSDRGRDDLVVPAAAVQLVAGKRVAFTVLGGDRFQSHELTVGVEQPDWVEVRRGLNAGDQVVTQGSFELKAVLQMSMLGGSG